MSTEDLTDREKEVFDIIVEIADEEFWEPIDYNSIQTMQTTRFLAKVLNRVWEEREGE